METAGRTQQEFYIRAKSPNHRMFCTLDIIEKRGKTPEASVSTFFYELEEVSLCYFYSISSTMSFIIQKNGWLEKIERDTNVSQNFRSDKKIDLSAHNRCNYTQPVSVHQKAVLALQLFRRCTLPNMISYLISICYTNAKCKAGWR